MVVTRLMGGVGNQLFQYAVGRRLAHLHDVSLKLDLSWYNDIPEGSTPRVFQLCHFRIKAEVADTDTLARCQRKSRGRRWIQRTLPWSIHGLSNGKIDLVQEREPFFDPGILELPDRVCLSGYWQNERYFNEISNLIRAEVTPATPLSPAGLALKRRVMQHPDAVSLHVRRGDYSDNKEINKTFGTLGEKYYRACVQRMADRLQSPPFLHFQR